MDRHALLCALLKLVRAQRVLAVGMGYTTPFLAVALRESAEETRAQAQQQATTSTVPMKEFAS